MENEILKIVYCNQGITKFVGGEVVNFWELYFEDLQGCEITETIILN